MNFDKTTVVFLIVLSLSAMVWADVAVFNFETTYFNNQGTPYDKPLNVEIRCYGYFAGPPNFQPTFPPDYKPEYLGGHSFSCPHYGCQTIYSTHWNYQKRDYCDLQAIAPDGESFLLHNYTKKTIKNEWNHTLHGLEIVTEIDLSGAQKDGSKLTATRDSFDSQGLAEAAVLTLVIESVVVFFLAGRLTGKQEKVSAKRLLAAGIVPSLITLPVLWFLTVTYNIPILVGEALVVLAETAMIKQLLPLDWKESFAVSIAANLASYAAGIALAMLGGF